MGILQGKVAFVTGVARGQGRSHAIRLAREGTDIIGVDLCADFDTVPYPMAGENDLKETGAAVEALDRRIVSARLDVRGRVALTDFVTDAVAQLGRLDVVVANAGISPLKNTTADSDIDATWQDVIGVNLTGVFNTVQASLPSLIAGGRGGSIIITSSTAGLVGLSLDTIGGYAYTASKHGVVGLMRGFARDLAQHSIRVNTVHPTGVATPMIMNPAMENFIGSRPETMNTLVNLADGGTRRHQQRGRVAGLRPGPIRHRGHPARRRRVHDQVTAPVLPMIDGWVNENNSRRPVDPAVGRLFPDLLERRRRGTTTGQLVEEMDGSGVSRAVLCAGYAGNDNLAWARAAVEKYPDRFIASLALDPRLGMTAVRALDSAVRDSGVRMARVLALETQLPYDHAVYFPIYAKCVELGIPISVNVGIPGPPVGGRCQDPIALDDVCAFFPELVVVMSHGGDPWADMCVKLMSKWPNLYYMSSAYSPRRIPSEVIDYLNGRGADKVMWASDYPVLEFARCREQILDMPLRDEQRRRKFAHDNALRVLFGEPVSEGLS